MIIFGTRSVKFTKGQGHFHCPQCACKAEYKHKSARRFFTLYFIPLIPLDKLGEYVECRSCRGTFVPRVLEYQQNTSSDQFLSEYEKAIKHTVVTMMLADGEIDRREKEVVLQVVNKFSHNDIDMVQLDQYVHQVRQKPADLELYLKRVAPRLNGHGKEIVVKCALSVAAADGHVDESEMALLDDIARTLDMTNSHLRGIMNEMKTPQEAVFSQN